MMKLIYWIIFLILSVQIVAQNSPYLIPYRSGDNSHYWKNKVNNNGYWQQDVAYEMKAAINDKEDIIDCHYFKVTYWNNSPHELKELYFHLYENAFQPQSYYHQLWLGNKQNPVFGKYEAQKKGTEIFEVKVNNTNAKAFIDNTIMKVELNEILKPGDSLTFTCRFKTYWDTGSMRRRNKSFNSFGFKHYDGVHWYPVVCVYDQKFGWHTDQHLDKEFYANFGSFNVELTFPNDYIVEATGVLLNEKEVLPDTLKQKLNLKNFAKKPFNSPPSILIPKDSTKSKTWKYYAVNVHNFAFTADPTYRIDEVEYKGIKVIALAQEPHASKWLPSAGFTAKVIDVYSNDFGEYIWPKIIIADANDGMEYPMITLDGGTYPQHQYLLAHEVGHMWFYGMLGSNETYRASMDEGFTQFLTIWAMDKITGPKKKLNAPYPFLQKYMDSSVSRYDRLYTPYLTDVWSGYDAQLNTHSSDFNGAIRQGGGYRLVYHKTGVMLYNLKYVLGDSLFSAAMKNYVKEWTGRHPYPEDFRNSVINFTKVDLNWFFDQWLETTKNIDYAVKEVKQIKTLGDSTEYKIVFKRIGSMQMPIDFVTVNKENQINSYHIPNTWFMKTTDAKILPKWYGWGLLNQEYTATLKVKGKIKDVIIDPERILADYDLTNNSYKKIDEWQLDTRLINPPSWDRKKIFWRPDLWWNQYDGLQLGLNANSDYFGQQYWNNFSVWYNTGFLQNNIPAEIKNKHQPIAFIHTSKFNLSKYWRQTYYHDEYQYNAGLFKMVLGFEKLYKNQDLRNPRGLKLFVNHSLLYRDKSTDLVYLLYPGLWSVNKFNNFINTGIQKTYPLKKGFGEWTMEIRTPGLGSDFNYSYLQFTNLHYYTFKKLELRTRLFARYGMGNTPFESALYLAGASPENLYNNRLTKARGFVPDQWTSYNNTINHFQMGGGLNLRGYAGYLASITKENVTYFNFLGKSGASISMELDFDRVFNIKPGRYTKYFHIDSYLFHDMGMLGLNTTNNNFASSVFRTSSGLGFAFSLKPDGFNIKPFTIRIDMPLLLNTPPPGEDAFKFRYIVGFNRTF